MIVQAKLNEGQPVLLGRPQPHIALVTINRPGARNAIDGDVTRAIDRIVKQTEADKDIRAVVLTGAGGKAFCAGADLRVIANGGLLSLFTDDGGFAGFVHAQREKFWIAAVDGFAMAGGCEIALACDAIVAGNDATFALPEVKRGLIASAGGLYRLPRALPRNIALELIATAEALSAPRAAAFGMVNRLAANGKAVEVALDMAGAISRNAPIAVRESLKVARLAADLDDRSLAQASDAGQQRIMATDDFHEGPLAFIEKREPRWSGR